MGCSSCFFFLKKKLEDLLYFTYKSHSTTSNLIRLYSNMRIHLSNFHGSVTVIHHPLIKFSLLTLTKLEVPPHAIVSKLLRKKKETEFSSHLGMSSKSSSIVVKYRHLGIDWLYFGQTLLTLVVNYNRLNTKCPLSV